MPDSPTPEQHVIRLGETIGRLKAFASTFNPDDEVDEESGLTGEDLDLTVELLEAIHAMAVNAEPANDRS